MPFFDPADDAPKASSASFFDPADDKPQPPSSAGRRALDIGVGLVKGVVDLPGAVVGLADTVAGGAPGRILDSIFEATGKAADEIGLPDWARPAQWSRLLGEQYTPETKAALRGVHESAAAAEQKAKEEGSGPLGQIGSGFVGAVQGIAQNPSSALILAAENYGGMKAIGKGTALALGKYAGELDAAVKSGSMTAEAANAALADRALKYAAAGEGILTAGQMGQQISAEAPEASWADRLAAVPAGVITGGISRLVGKIPGLGDAETTMATAELGKTAGVSGGALARAGKGVLSEGVLQELPQSAQEQMWQNLAEGKPLQEGVGEQAATGLVTGGALGGATALRHNPQPPAPADILDAPDTDSALRTYAAAVDGAKVDTESLLSAARQTRVAAETQSELMQGLAQADLEQARINQALNVGEVVQDAEGAYHVNVGEQSAPLRVWDETETPDTVPAAQVAAQREHYKQLGIDLVYYEDSPLLPDGVYDPRQPGVLFLSNNPQRNATQIAAHEVTHALQAQPWAGGLTMGDLLNETIREGVTDAGWRHAMEQFSSTMPEPPKEGASIEEQKAWAAQWERHMLTELAADIGGEATKFETFLPKVVARIEVKHGEGVAKEFLSKFIEAIKTAYETLKKFFSDNPTLSQTWVSNLEQVHDVLADMYARQYGEQLASEKARVREMQRQRNREMAGALAQRDKQKLDENQQLLRETRNRFGAIESERQALITAVNEENASTNSAMADALARAKPAAQTQSGKDRTQSRKDAEKALIERQRALRDAEIAFYLQQQVEKGEAQKRAKENVDLLRAADKRREDLAAITDKRSRGELLSQDEILKEKLGPIAAPEGASPDLKRAFESVAKAPFLRSADEKVNLKEVEEGRRFSPKKAAWNEKRIDRLINTYAYAHNDRTKAWAAPISPKEFLRLTASAADMERIAGETDDLDTRRLADEHQEMYLVVEPSKDGLRVVSHEGRHRMLALMRSGVGEAPVAIYDRTATVKQPGELVLLPQRNVESKSPLRIGQAVPIHARFRSELAGLSGAGEQVRFSPKKPATLNIGLDINNQRDALSVDAALAAVRLVGGKIARHAGPYRSDSENTLVVELERPLTGAQMERLALNTRRDAIPQHVENGSELYGPKAKEWGPFNPELFVTMDGRRLSAPLPKGMVSSRVPSATPRGKNAAEVENPLAQRLQVGLEAFRGAPEAFDNAVRLLTQYVNWHPNPRLRGASARAEKFISDAVANLLWLHDQVPADIRARSKLWYDGANRIANMLADRYGVSVEQASAVIAVNSPQTDWFVNVSRAERILDIWFREQNTPWSREMDLVANGIYDAPQYAEDLEGIRGRTLADLAGDALRQSMWIRAFDQAHNDRAYRIVTPEGRFAGLVTNVTGATGRMPWAALAPTGKSIEVLNDGSIANISLRLGNEHKVRSFYNNIISPNDQAGDVTIDTHAVAAALLRPLSGASTEVLHNLGAGVSNAFKGLSGTYGIYAEAYRRAAAQRGLLPREMQSITWEAIRGLYTDVFKRSAGADQVEQAWAEYRSGQLSEEQVRERIHEIAGGINAPAWRSSSRASEEAGSSSYPGKLPAVQLSGRGSGSATGGDTARGRASNGDRRGTVSRGASRARGDGRADGTSSRFSPKKPGELDLVGVHFSHSRREVLNGAYYGTGMKGAEAQHIAAATDPRVKIRVYAYINTGKGVFPEKYVGGQPHKVALQNLYDLNADPLSLAKLGDYALESAVLDAGYSGYLVRDFGNQGAAVILGDAARAVRAEPQDLSYRGQDLPTPPEPQYAPAKKLAMDVAASRDLPAGEMTGADWKKILEKISPVLYGRMLESGALERIQDGQRYYRDQLVAYSPKSTRQRNVSGNVQDSDTSTERGQTINVDGVERPRTNSNGRPIATDDESLRNFWRWFGDSKVVDEQGRPQVVYHGTIVRDSQKAPGMGDIVAFDRLFTTKFRAPSIDTVGSWFSTNPGDGGAEMYSTRGEGSTIYPAYLSIQNEQSTTFHLMSRRARLLANGSDDGRRVGASEVEAYRRWLETIGKDGVRVESSGNDGSTEFENQTAWIALEPTQIKSAIGNNGQFSPTNPDIRYSPKSPVWYSALARSLESAKVSAAPPSGWRDLIKGLVNKGTVKAAEVEASGINDWLSLQQGKITREQVADFVAQNGVPLFSPKIVGASRRKYTSAHTTFFQNVGRAVTPPTIAERIGEMRKDLGKKLAQGLVDQFAPLKDMSLQAYTLARLSKGSGGAFEAMLHHGKIKLRDGAYDADRSGGFVERLGVPLHGELEDFLWWVAANRAERLAKEDRENLFSASDIAAGKSLSEGTTGFDYRLQHGPARGTVTRNRAAIFRDALKTFEEFNKNALDMAEQSGLIDSETRPLWEHEFYVPFYRQSEAEGFVGAKLKNGIVRQKAFEQLKGGKEKINSDILQNTLSNWAHLLDASAKNRAAKASLEAAVAAGVAIEANERTVREMAGAIGKPNSVVWFQEQGANRYFVVDDPYVLTAITSLEYAGMRGPVMDAMSKMKHWLTIGVTASPAFKIRNLIRDSVQAIASSPLSYNPVTNIKEGFSASNRSSQDYVSALASGGLIRFGVGLEGRTSDLVRQLIKQGVKDSTVLDSDEKLRAFYDQYIEPAVIAYQELGNRGEEINRSALFKQLKSQGVDHATAALMARDLMDFSMNGAWSSIRLLTQVVPFMNARMQGLYKLGRAAKDDPKRFAIVLGAVAMASIALLAAYGDDPDWDKRENWDRENYFWFKIGGTAFRIPRPFEIGAIAVLAERGVEYFTDEKFTGKMFRQSVLRVLGENLNFNPTPQLVKPILDVYANKDSFSERPIETAGMENLRPDYRFTSRTSMAARATSTAGQAVTSAIGANFLSPVQIDHMLQGYFGWLGAFVVGAADLVARPASGQPERPSPDYWKLATQGFVTSLPEAQSRYVSHLYEQAKEVEQAYGTYRELVRQGKTSEAQEFLTDNRTDISRFRTIERVKKAESILNERTRAIERSNRPADEKRRLIDQLTQQKDRLARAVR